MRKLSVLCVLVLIVGLLAACGGNNGGNANGGAPAPSAGGSGNGGSGNGSSAPADGEGGPPALTAETLDRIVELAQQEGKLLLYTGLPLDAATTISEKFTEKYGVQVEIWRANGSAVLQRVTQEAQAGLATWDVLEAGDAMPGVHEQGLLQIPMDDIYFEDLPAGLVPEDKSHVPVRANLIVGAYNTSLVNAADLPATYEDLLDPKWKGKLAVETSNHFWLKDLVEAMGDEEQGLQLFRDIVATNGLTVREGHSLLAETVSNGEIPYSLHVYNNKVDSLKEDGAPVEMHVLKPAIVYPIALGLAKNANSPNAAKLYVHFMMNEGQELLKELYFNPTSDDVESILTEIPEEDLVFQNHFENLQEMEKWTQLYDEIIVSKSTVR